MHIHDELDRPVTSKVLVLSLILTLLFAVVEAVSGVRAVPRGVSIVTYLTDEWYAAAVHIESTALLEAVNQSLTRLDESGEMARIQALWLHGR